MTELEKVCRELLRKNVSLVEDFCECAIYAPAKDIEKSGILDDPGFPTGFKKISKNYGNKKNFANLVHRELKKITLEEVMMRNPSLIKIVQLSRLFMKSNKQEKEDIKTVVADLMQTDALYIAICERKNLKKWNLELSIEEEDKEILRRVKFYLLASKETGKKRE